MISDGIEEEHICRYESECITEEERDQTQ